jgi:predicted RNA-binding Zn ribbon-like protein
MADLQHDVTALRLLGGRLCIDFVNTVENRAGEVSEDFLTACDGLVRWGEHAGIVTGANAAQLLDAAARDQQGAERVLLQAIELRETMHRVFLAIATDRQPDERDLEGLRRAYERAIGAARLAPEGERFVWSWRADGTWLDSVLWPVVLSAVELLTEGELRRVKVCANPHGCGWLFYDASKNRSRRWCRMEGCGSQIKMRRHYARHRAKTRNAGDSN